METSESASPQTAASAPQTQGAKAYVFAKQPRISWWIAAGLAVILALGVIDFFVTSKNWQWPIVWEYLFHPDILSGLKNTVFLTLICGLTGLVAGGVVAYLRMSSNPIFRAFGTIYIWVIRAIPALVLLLFIFFLAALLPRIPIGLPFMAPIVSFPTNQLISQSTAAILGLTMIQAAYIGEIYRGGILSVGRGQLDAAKSLGMTRGKAMLRIIAPQSVRVIIPPLGNEMITLFKNTSLVFVIGYTELLTTVQLIYGVNYQIIPLLTVACIWYLVLTSLAMLGQRLLEKRYGKGFQGVTNE